MEFYIDEYSWNGHKEHPDTYSTSKVNISAIYAVKYVWQELDASRKSIRKTCKWESLMGVDSDGNGDDVLNKKI